MTHCRLSDRKRSRLVLRILLAVGLMLLAQEGRSDDCGEAPAIATGGFWGSDDASNTPCCRQLTVMIEQQKALITRETGQLRRELAALRNDLARPGLKEIAAGIGYIFGLAGVGLYLCARRDRDRRA